MDDAALRVGWRHYRISKIRGDDGDRRSSAGLTSSLLPGWWAMDHFEKPFARPSAKEMRIRSSLSRNFPEIHGEVFELYNEIRYLV